MKRLGVNIDHIATLRNARGEKHPDPLYAAKKVISYGADSVTIHLREDRRHINDIDAKKICGLRNVPVNLEISMNEEIVNKALKIKPNFICLVPENRKEITTEGGLNVKNNLNKLEKIIKKFKKAKIRTSLFINPSPNDIRLAKKLNADCIEIHTGKFCNMQNDEDALHELNNIKKAAKYAKSIGLEVHAGHGLTYKSAFELSKISSISEFNIGHFLISESLFLGLNKAIKRFKKVIST